MSREVKIALQTKDKHLDEMVQLAMTALSERPTLKTDGLSGVAFVLGALVGRIQSLEIDLHNATIDDLCGQKGRELQ